MEFTTDRQALRQAALLDPYDAGLRMALPDCLLEGGREDEAHFWMSAFRFCTGDGPLDFKQGQTTLNSLTLAVLNLAKKSGLSFTAAVESSLSVAWTGYRREIPEGRLVATYIPQEWRDDRRQAENLGVYLDFDATEAFLRNDLNTINDWEERSENSDSLVNGQPFENLHSGPFEVDCAVGEWLFDQGCNSLYDLLQEDLDRLRQEYNVGPPYDDDQSNPTAEEMAAAREDELVVGQRWQVTDSSFHVASSLGNLRASPVDGIVLSCDLFDEVEDDLKSIEKFDVAEYESNYGGEGLAGASIDILDIGYWTVDGIYEPPARQAVFTEV